MSINSINPNNNASVVKALDPGASAQEKMQEVNDQQKQEQAKPEELTDDQKNKAVDGFYFDTGMSTDDFMVLRTQASEGTYEVLDRAISKMKENAEAVGDAIETIAEIAKKTSKENIALQVLQKTLDAMDKTQGDK